MKLNAFSQSYLTLEEVISASQKKSIYYKVALNSLQKSTWDYKNFLVFKKPGVYLEANIPQYNRSISKITLPNGEDEFVSQNQSFSALNLSIQQQVAATGGKVVLGTSLNRIDVFGNSRSVNYASTPLSISYVQSNIGFNYFKWLKRIEPMKYEVASKKFILEMENISISAVDAYFELLIAGKKIKLTEQNLANIDTLIRITVDRNKIGATTHGELLQLRLTKLSYDKQKNLDSINYVSAQQKLLNLLGVASRESIVTVDPSHVKFVDIPLEKAVEISKEKSPEILKYRLERLEADRNLSEIKSETGLKFHVNANLGFSNTSPDIASVFNNLQNQQSLNFGFTLPLLDWGNSKTKRLTAEANISLIENAAKQRQIEVEQEIFLLVSKWNIQMRKYSNAVQRYEISKENFELEKQKFIRGAISLNDLNIAQDLKDNCILSLFETIWEGWKLHYTIRKLSLYDFNLLTEIRYSVKDELF